MPPDTGTHDFIIVNAGQPRINTNSLRSPSTSINLDRSPATGRSQSSSRPRSSSRPGDSLDQLRALPIQREIPWYEGKELPLEKAIESIRVQTRGACLLATRGQVQNPPCSHCATGVGRFSQCISSDDWFHGACATCQLATRGNLCSLRGKDTLRIKQENSSKQEETDAMNAIPRKKSPPSMKQPNTGARPRPQILPASRTHVAEDAELSSSKKRKRETLQGTSVWKPYISPYLPATPSNSIQPSLSGPPPFYPSSNTTYASHSNMPPQLNYIYQRGDHINGRRVSPPSSAKPPNPKVMKVQINESSSHRQESRKDLNGHGRGREATDSLSPSAQLLGHFEKPTVLERPTIQGFLPINAEKTKPKKPIPLPDPPLIDTLPRKKQKQIYSMIGGLQSGIRSCKQQADSMQQQLNLLQAALGIDIETDDDESIPEK